MHNVEFLQPGVDNYLGTCSISLFYVLRSQDPENLNDSLVVTWLVRDRDGMRVWVFKQGA